MPQIDQLGESWYFASQLFWLVIVFGAIYVFIGHGMLPKVEATVDLRDRKIADDLAAARGARDDADRIEADWRTRTNAARAEAQAAIAAAKAEGAGLSATRLAASNAAVESRLAAAEADIAVARSAALREIEGVASEVAGTLVQRLTGRAVPPAQIHAAVKAKFDA